MPEGRDALTQERDDCEHVPVVVPDERGDKFHPVEQFGEFPWDTFHATHPCIGRYNIRNEEAVYIHIDERTPDGEGVNEYWEIPASLESLLWLERGSPK